MFASPVVVRRQSGGAGDVPRDDVGHAGGDGHRRPRPPETQPARLIPAPPGAPGDELRPHRRVSRVNASRGIPAQQKGVWRWLVHVLDITHSRKVCGIGWCTF